MGFTDTSGASDQATLAFYDREAEAYVAGTKDGVVRWLAGFMQMLPPGGRILELGCGSGRDAQVLLSHGFDVEPTDGTPAMAAQAQERLQKPVKVMRFDELADIEKFDGVWAHASLLHVPRPALSVVLARVYRALKPGGLFFANYKSGNTEGRDPMDRYYNYLDQPLLTQAYRSSATWEMLSVESYAGQSFGGDAADWLAVTARRPLFQSPSSLE